MAVIINVEQSPLTITPSNGEHVYTLSSTAYTYTNFKYLIDVYFRPNSVDPQYATRLKVRPNQYGKAIFELEEIVRTFLKSNTRFSGTTYPYLNYVAEENSVITLSDATNTRTYNAYNLWPGGSPNANLEQLWHVEQYKIVVGCEYTSGSTTVTDIDENASFQPSPINIFPGVDNSLIPQPYLSAATLGSAYTQSPNFFQVANQGWYYYDLFRYKLEQGDDKDCGPRQFLNAAGGNQVLSQPGIVSGKVRRRMHHPDCPIIVSFLDGQNDYFTNSVGAVAIRSALSKSDPYTYSAHTLNDSTLYNVWDIFKMGVFYLPYNVTQEGTNVIPTNSEKICFYTVPNSASLDFDQRSSEILEYYIQEPDCINEPIHVLFLNSKGMWDTYTFGKKSSKTIEVDRKKYQQEASLNKQFYARGSSQRGLTVYEQFADYKIQCSSWYMDENDTEIVQEFFMSPEVFIITGNTLEVDPCYDPASEDCTSCLGEIRMYQHLIPVVIDDKTFEVYQKQYQKIFQYQFTLSYGSVKRYRTQG